MKLLNLPIVPGTIPSKDTVKTAYRNLAMTYHPDRLLSSDPKRSDKAKLFTQITSSYQYIIKYIEDSKRG